MKVPRVSFHLHLKLGSIWVRFAGREFFTQSAYCQRKIVAHYRRGAQPLYGIPALGNRFRGLIDRALEASFGFLWTLRQQIRRRLKSQQQPVKTLQQRIVRFPRNARPLIHTCF